MHPYYFEPIEISAENPETLVVEKASCYRKMIEELVREEQSNEGAFVVSKDNQIQQFSKTVSVITDLFHLDLENRTMKTRIQSYLAEVSSDSEAGMKLVSDIKRYAFSLCEETVYPVLFDADFQLPDLIKFLNFRFYPDTESLTETIVEYLFGTANIMGKKLFITVNLKDFLDEAEYCELIKQIQYRNIQLLMLEHHTHEGMDDPRHLRIIDKDLCVIQ